MFIVIFYWVVFIMLYLSGLFVFVKVHMDENMGERNDKKEDKEEAVENDEAKEEKRKERVPETPTRKIRKVKSEYNLRSRKKDVRKKKPAED